MSVTTTKGRIGSFAALALTLTLTASIGVGCGSPEAENSAAEGSGVAKRSVASDSAKVPDIVTTAASIARQIEADPDNIDAILADHDLDVEKFEEMMYEISSDPALTEAYNSALE